MWLAAYFRVVHFVSGVDVMAYVVMILMIVMTNDVDAFVVISPTLDYNFSNAYIS